MTTSERFFPHLSLSLASVLRCGPFMRIENLVGMADGGLKGWEGYSPWLALIVGKPTSGFPPCASGGFQR